MSTAKAVPKTHVFEIRGDIRTFAAIARYLLTNGVHIKTKSELGSESMELLLSILIANGKATKFTSSESALEYLQDVKLDGTKGNRGLEALAKQIQIETGMSVLVSDEPTETEADALLRAALAKFND